MGVYCVRLVNVSDSADTMTAWPSYVEEILLSYDLLTDKEKFICILKGSPPTLEECEV